MIEWGYYARPRRQPTFRAIADRYGVRYVPVVPRPVEGGYVEYVGVETPDVEKGPHSPPTLPFDLSTAIAPTPVSPTQTGSTPVQTNTTGGQHDRLPADLEILFPHSKPTFSYTDDDGDQVEIHNVFPEQEQGAQVWLTATGEDGQRVQVALDAESLIELGQHLVHQGEDLFNAGSAAWLAAGDE